MDKELEYYEFTYKIPKYKIKPPLNFSKYYQIHKDEIIIDLQQENKQLKDNWNKLKEYIDIKLYNVEYLQKLCGCRIDDEIHMILDIIKKEMQKLEQGSDSNE